MLPIHMLVEYIFSIMLEFSEYIINKIPAFNIPNIFYKQEPIKMFCDKCNQYSFSKYRNS